MAASSHDVTSVSDSLPGPEDVLGAQQQWRRVWGRLRRRRLALLALAFLSLILLLAILAPLLDRFEPTEAAGAPLQPPSSEHWMGTDSLGRDLWSRIVHGARISIEVAVVSQIVAMVLGVAVGALAGWFGSAGEAVLMRLTDVAIALPPILLALMFVSAFGNTTIVLALAIGLATWPILARLVRSQVLFLKEMEFTEASVLMGARSLRVLRTHIVPNLLGVVVVQLAFGLSQAIFAEAFLSFIGLGPPAPAASWGRLVSDGFEFIRVESYLVIFPVLAISLTVLAANMLGDALRDALDPKSST